MKIRSLLWRFAIPVTVIEVIVILVLSIFFTQTSRNNYLDDVKKDLSAEIDLLLNDIDQQNLGIDQVEKFQLLADRYADPLQVRVTIIRQDGTVLADSEADPAKMDNHLSRPEVQQALSGQTGAQIRFSKTLNTDLYYIAVSKIAGGNTLVVRMAEPLVKINEQVARANQFVWLAGAIAILLTFGITLLISRKTIQPIDRLTKAASSISTGDFVEIRQNRSRDEIGVLTHAFNEMAYKIESQFSALNQEKAKINAIIEQMADGIVIVDQDGTVQLFNPEAERMFGRGTPLAIGKSLTQNVKTYQIIDLWKKTLETQRSQNLNFEILPGQYYLHVVTSILKDTSPRLVLLLFQDLTHVHQLERVRQDFVSNVSHELRTPLASLKALNETAERCLDQDPSAARHFLSSMDNEIDKLDQMVAELLELSRIESGKVPLNRTPAQICTLLNQSMKRMQMQADRAGITFSVSCNETIPEIFLDGERIERVLVNLIHNAIKFTPPGGKIQLSAELQEKDVVVHVMDTGAGIEEKDLPRIFERFYKTDRSRATGGTGLGLSIARHVVEAHGGKIWAESVYGQGSTFSFTLPVKQ